MQGREGRKEGGGEGRIWNVPEGLTRDGVAEDADGLDLPDLWVGRGGCGSKGNGECVLLKYPSPSTPSPSLPSLPRSKHQYHGSSKLLPPSFLPALPFSSYLRERLKELRLGRGRRQVPHIERSRPHVAIHGSARARPAARRRALRGHVGPTPVHPSVRVGSGSVHVFFWFKFFFGREPLCCRGLGMGREGGREGGMVRISLKLCVCVFVYACHQGHRIDQAWGRPYAKDS